MINNYNSLGSGRDTWSKNDVGEVIGSPPNSPNKALTKSWLSCIMMMLLFLSGLSSFAQTTVISGTGAGSFEGATLTANGWLTAQSVTNGWAVGSSAGSSDGTNAVYVNSTSSNGGAWTYNIASTQANHIYRDITYPAGENLATITFDLKGAPADLGFDRMRIFVCPTTVTPVAGTEVTIGALQIYSNDAALATYSTQSASFSRADTGGTATARIIITWRNDGSVGSGQPYAIDKFNLVTAAAANITAVQGGLLNSPATWAGGVVPASGNDVTIPAGVIVTVNQALSYRDLTVNGTLQWAGTFAGVFSGNVLVGSTGRFLPYSTLGTGQSLTVGGNFQNDGYANLALPNTSLNFNGSGSTLSGSGVFQGDGTKGIIRALTFSNTGSNSISTTQNLIVTAGLAHTAGSLNTNGKLAIDNTTQVYGQPLNLQVANIAVTNMGTLYSVAPVVFGASVTQWSAITGVLGTLYVSGSNVYRCSTAGSIGATAPTHTSGVVSNLLWIGTTGTLGNPFQLTAVTVGTQYFYGGNLYTCTVAGIPSSLAPPVHTSSTAVSGGATFLYVGTPATTTVNYDAVTQSVRSLNLTNAGAGYSSAPSTTFNVGVLSGTGSGAVALAVYIQQVAGPANSQFQKSGGSATVSGGLTINSDQGTSVATSNPQASSGVGAISATTGGVNYTVAPTVGFSLPTALNLVVNTGSGYAAVPTVTVTGGNLVSGTALTGSNFTVTVNNGTVESVYLTGGTAAYSTLPTISVTGGATLAFPAGCMPTATAVIGSNGQITNYNVTNAGYGYVVAPTVGIGATTATINGGTFTTVAGTPTARIALYNLTLNNFIPSPAPVANGDDAAIPSNRKINVLTMGGPSAGLNLSSSLTLFGSSTPLSLTAGINNNVINLGGNNLNFTWNTYTGTTSTFGSTNAYVKNGSITMNSRGGGNVIGNSTTLNFPFASQFTWNSGTTLSSGVNSGSSVTKVTVTETAAPTNALVGTGIAIGNKAYNVAFGQIGSPPVFNPATGLNPTVTMSFNSTDGLTGTQDQLFVAESTALTGAWNVKSTAFGASGALPATGSKATATVAPGPIAPTMSSYYAFSGATPTITGVLPLTVCANSGTFTITGTNLTGVTAVTIGGTAVSSFTVVNATTITGIAGNGTNGFISVTKSGSVVTGIETVTVSPSPAAPSLSATTASINLGGTVNVTATGGAGTFNWFNAATGGTLLFTGATFSQGACGNIWVSENNGSCDGARSQVTVTVAPTIASSSIPFFCGTGSSTTLSVSPVDPNITYTWTSLTPSATLATSVGSSVSATLTETSNFQVVATTPAGCTTTNFVSVGVYPLPSATVTTTASGVCPGTSATIGSGLSAGSFTSVSIPHAPLTAPATAVTLVTGGVPTPALTSGSLDDGGWAGIPIGFNFDFFGTQYSSINVGTNGTLQFGTYSAAGLGDFTFTTLPSTTEPFNMVAVLAMDNDLGGATGGAIKYWTEGYAPNRKFVISYENVKEFGDTKFSTAQAVFYETTGVIEPYISSSTNVDRVKLVGVNNGTGTIGVLAYNSGTVASVSNPQNPISTAFGFRFSPPANYTTVWSKTDTSGTSVITTAPTNVFSLTVSPTETTTYSISYTNTTTGCSNAPGSASVLMTVLGTSAPVGVNTLAATNPICLGGTTALSLDYAGIVDGIVFQWQQSTNGGVSFTDIASANVVTYVAAPTADTQYRVSMISCLGTPSFSTPVAITFTNNILTTTPATRCGTGPISLSATANPSASVVWYATASGGTALFNGATFPIASLATTSTFYAAAETNGPLCLSVRVPVVATVTPAPALTLNVSTATICTGFSTSSVTISSGAGSYNTYAWSPSVGVSGNEVSGWVFNPTISTVYTLIATETAGAQCSTTATLNVTVNAANVTTAVSASTICLGLTSTLTATSTALSSGPSTLPGTYCVADSSGGAGSTPIATVAINTLSTTTGTPVAPYSIIHPAIGSETTTLTSGQTYPLTVTSTGATIASVWFDWNRDGVYGATEWTQLWTSATSGTINVTVPANAVAGATGMRVRTRGAGNSSVNTDGCTAYFSGTSEDFTVNVIGSTDATASYTYGWTSVPAGFTASTSSITVAPTLTTVYTVTATNPATGCVTTDTKTVTVNTDPVANITGGSSTLCIGGATADFDSVSAGIIWTATPTGIVTIDVNSGLTTAVAVGTVTINASVFNPTTGCTTFALNPQTVTVGAPVVITSQPINQNILVGDNTSFTVTTTGTVSSYQWKVSTDGGVVYNNVPVSVNYTGANTSVLNIINAPASFTTYIYQCLVTASGSCPSPVISSNAILSVENISISGPSPLINTICSSGSANFTATLSGPAPDAIIWELFDTPTSSWTTLDALATGTFGSIVWTGETTNSLTLNGISLLNNGWKVRATAVLNDPLTIVTTNESLITVNSPAVITASPSNQTVCYSGATTTFSGTATGSKGFQWEYSDTANPWANVVDGIPSGITYSGVTSATLNVTTTALTSASGDKNYRLVAKSPTSCPDTVSNVAQLLINTPVVTANASLQFICNPGFTPVTLTASGANTYVWSPAATLSASIGATVTANPTATTTYTVTGTDASGCSISTQVIVLVGNPVTATVTATPAIVCPSANSQLLAAVPVLTNTVADYTFAKSSGTYTALVGGSPLANFGSSDDSFTPLQNIGFNFNYEGNTFSDFSMSTNGYLRLGALVSGTDYTAIDGTDTNVIAFNNRDLNNTGAVYSYQVSGTSPNRVCKIEAKNFYRYNTPAHTGNAQIWLYETSGKIEFHYGAYAPTWSSGFGVGTTQIGLTGAGSARTLSGTTWSGITNSSIGNSTTATVTQETTNQVVSGTIFGFTPPIISTYTYAWSPSTYLSSTSIANPVATNVTAPITYTVVVTSNIGCVETFTTSVDVQSGVTITTQPINIIACQATIANFSVVAAGAGITYQWRKNGVNITGNASAFSANLALPNITTNDNGTYDVVLIPLCGAASTSTGGTLVVNPTPTLSTVLTPLTVCAGTLTTPITLSGTPLGVTFNIAGGSSIGLSDLTNVTSIPAFTTTAGTATISVIPVANGCQGATSTVVYTVNALPLPFTLSPATSVSCSSEPAILISVVETPIVVSNVGGCLTGSQGAFGSGNSSVCNGVTPTVIATNSWAGESSSVTFNANAKYVFNSSIATDYVTISNSTNTAILAAGPTPLTWYSGATPGTVTFWLYTNASCGEQQTSRTKSFVCSPMPTYSFTPLTGLFTDAAGTIAYTGTATKTVYAKPTTNQTYTATTINAGGCPRTATATVTGGIATTWYADADGDGFGNAITASILACARPVGYVANSTDCDDTLPGVNPAQTVKTQLRAYQCGSTLGAIGYSIYADVVSGATGYRFIVKNMTTLATQTIDKTVHVFALTQLPSYEYGTAYSINVLVKKSNNVWLGDCSTATCIINTPLLTSSTGSSQLSGSSCGATLANVGNTIYANTVANATGYQFRVTNNVTNATEVFTRTLHWFTLASLTTGGQYGTSYTVEVAVKTTGLFGAYGNSCTVTTPPAPALLAGSCGGVATNRSTAFYCPNFNGVSVYRFQLYNPITFVTQTIDRPANWFNFSQFPGFALNTVYEVRISVKSGTAFSPVGAMCTVTSPIAVARGEFAEIDDTITVDQDFKVIALPNPFTSNFGLDMKSFNESNVNIQIYDMIGKLLESRDVEYNDVYNQSIGERYPSGVYNVIVSQGENVKTLRVIKQ